MAFARGRRQGARGARRPMDWICGDNNDVLASGLVICSWLVPPDTVFKGMFTDPTLMALMCWAQIGLPAQADTNGIVGMGIIPWNFTDDTVPTECPGPVTDCDADWAWLWLVPTVTSTARVLYQPGDSHDRLSKARRKLGNDRALLLVFETVLTTGDSDFHLHARALIKE